MGKALSWVAIAIATVVASLFTFGTAGAALIGGIIMATAVVTAATTVAILETQRKFAKASLKNELEYQQQQVKSDNIATHGQASANEWNYMEVITTDFDRETMACKRCIKSRKCKKSRWSLIHNRYCVSWEKWEEEPRCNELQF